jgi:hypothetical protein
MKNYTCQDCKYYYKEHMYCTGVFKGKKYPPSTPICSMDFFEKGVFDDRFWILAKPLEISLGYFYVIIDREDELKDYNGDNLSFSYESEAEDICEFLNKQEKRIRELTKNGR